MDLFFVNEEHRQNFEVLEKLNSTTFQKFPETKATAYVLSHPELYLTFESETTKCLNGWSKRYETNESDQRPNLWGLAEYLSGRFPDPFIHELVDVFTDENYHVFITAMNILRDQTKQAKAGNLATA